MRDVNYRGPLLHSLEPANQHSEACALELSASHEKAPYLSYQSQSPQFLNSFFESCIFSMCFERSADSADICAVKILVVCEVFPLLTIVVVLRKQSSKKPNPRQEAVERPRCKQESMDEGDGEASPPVRGTYSTSRTLFAGPLHLGAMSIKSFFRHR